jgi:SAM-dependent methyltransferase
MTMPKTLEQPTSVDPSAPTCPACGAALGPPELVGRDRLLSRPGSFAVASCSACGLAATVPRLSGSDLEAHYPSTYEPYRVHGTDITSSALSRVRALHMAMRLRRPPLRELFSAAPGRLLDVGCGRGDLAAAFVRRGWDVAGVDPSAAAAEIARAQGVDAHAGTLDDAPWPPASFDAVLFHHSLEHIADPVGALRQARELLRPGGRVVVCVPYWGSWQRRRFRSYWFHLDLPRHLQHFDADTLRDTARRAGLTPLAAYVTTSAAGLFGTLQYLAFGRCVFGGALTMPAQGATVILYPLSALIGRVLGGDSLGLTAERGPS